MPWLAFSLVGQAFPKMFGSTVLDTCATQETHPQSKTLKSLHYPDPKESHPDSRQDHLMGVHLPSAKSVLCLIQF